MPRVAPLSLVALQRLVGPAAAPPAGPDESVARGDPAPHREDQPEREVGGGGGRHSGSVRDHDPALATGVHVHEVEAGAVVRDDAEVRKSD